jgi:hypothetical protein
MQQVKIFRSLENDLAGMEDQINAWIRRSGARVLSITGNLSPQSPSPGAASPGLGRSAFAPSDVLLVVLYEAADA